MKESALTRRILLALNRERHCLAIKIHGGAYSRAGEPDIVGSCAGQAFALEVKVGSAHPSQFQQHRIREWYNAGATVHVAREDFDPHKFCEALRESTPVEQELFQ